MRRLLLICITLILTPLVALANPAQKEEIASYDVYITVNKDASINVSEVINVYVAGKVIKRGLIRTLPTSYVDSYGIGRHSKYVLNDVLVNGKKSPYHIKHDFDTYAIYVGTKSHLLSPGWYTYTFNYTVNDAVNFLKDADELYWNITGNGWKFPIQMATAIITLPEGANITHHYAYTGKKGTKGNAYITNEMAPNKITFTTTAELPPKSGLTVAVAWPKGIVIETDFLTKLKYEFDANPGVKKVTQLALVTICYFFIVWLLFGVDPKRGTIIPRFVPPDNVTAAQSRYIMQMGFDMKVLTAAIVSLATKGFITISSDNSDFTIKKIETPKNTANGYDGVLLGLLFSEGNTVDIKTKNHELVNELKSSLKTHLYKQNNRIYFYSNFIFCLPGIVLFLIAAAVAIFTSDNHEQTGFILAWLSIWSIGVSLLLKQTYCLAKKARAIPSILSFIAVIFMLAFSTPFLIGWFVGLFILMQSVSLLCVISLLVIVLFTVTFLTLMKQPTKAGRKLMDEIEGFRLFLSTTDKHRLKDYSPPEITQDLYEKYLPYAIALDVESAWGQQFNAELVAAGQDPVKYQPAWYSGSRWSGGCAPAAFSAAMASGLSSSLSSTSVSSSGSSGGGFSGGGGGGGGGGGW